MADFPAVKTIGEFLSEMSNRDAQTNQMLSNTQLINARIPYEQAATAELIQKMKFDQMQFGSDQIFADISGQELGKALTGQSLQGQRQAINQQGTATKIEADQLRQQKQVEGQAAKTATDTAILAMLKAGVPEQAIEANANSETTVLQNQLQKSVAEKQAWDNIAQRAASVGGGPAMSKHVKDANLESSRLGREINQTRMDLGKAQAQQIDKVGALTNSVLGQNSQEALDAAVPLLREVDPLFGYPKPNQPDQFDRNQDGSLRWSDKTKQQFKTYADRSQTARQQNQQTLAELKERNAEEKRQADIAKEKAQTERIVALAARGQAGVKQTPEEKALDKFTASLESRASRAPFETDRDYAKESVKDYVKKNGQAKSFDTSTYDRYAEDVAQRANEIRAEKARDAKSKSDVPSLTEARQQAVQELSKFVHGKDGKFSYDPGGEDEKKTPEGPSILDRFQSKMSELLGKKEAPKASGSIVYRPKTQAEVDSLPSGALVEVDGQQFRKK